MRKRDVRRWARRQSEAEPWPRWVRWLVIGAVVAVVIGKLVGWI